MYAENRKKILALALILFCLALFSSATVLGPGMQVEPFYTWYYLFAWWPFILAGEAALSFRGRSLLFKEPLRFLLLLPLSVCIWLIFECFNFRLQNWHYINLPQETSIRWVGYFFSYASVLPGLAMVKELLTELGAGKYAPEKRLDLSSRLRELQILGAVMLTLPLIAPKFFFPLVWGGFIFLIDPFLYKKGQPSFILNIKIGRWREFFLWLYSGLICGFLWELWNYQAGSKWFYTVPFVGRIKLFEMPVLGFLGFPPFALECTLLAALFFYLKGKVELKPRGGKTAYTVLSVCAAAVFCLTVFALIDRFTVVSFQ